MVAYGVGKNRETNKEHDKDCADWGSVGQGGLLQRWRGKQESSRDGVL